jgi:hypothetical protein
MWRGQEKQMKQPKASFHHVKYKASNDLVIKHPSLFEHKIKYSLNSLFTGKVRFLYIRKKSE